jgi:hypothetical protein
MHGVAQLVHEVAEVALAGGAAADSIVIVLAGTTLDVLSTSVADAASLGRRCGRRGRRRRGGTRGAEGGSDGGRHALGHFAVGRFDILQCVSVRIDGIGRGGSLQERSQENEQRRHSEVTVRLP